MSFFGRRDELRRLQEFLQQDGTGLLCVRGRRRIGKTSLLEALNGKHAHSFFFYGASEESDRNARARFAVEWDAFTKQQSLSLLTAHARTWAVIFDHICQYAKNSEQDLLLIFDEVQWLQKKRSDFVGTLKGKWSQLQQTSTLKLIISGSSNKFFQKQVDHPNAALRGLRTSADIEVMPFSLTEVRKYWFPHWTNEQICLLYMMIGGVPYYLERISPNEPNFLRAINNAVFSASSIFLDEIEAVLNLEFTQASKKNVIRVLSALGQDGSTQENIREKTGLADGTLASLLNRLQDYKIIHCKLPFGQKPKANSRGVKYYMRDFYLNFYFQILAGMEHAIRLNTTGGQLFRCQIGSNAGYYIKDFSGKAFEHLIISILENRAQQSPKVFGILDLSGNQYRVGTYWEKGVTQIDIIVEDDTDRETRIIEAKWVSEKTDASASYVQQVRRKKYSPPEDYCVRHFLALSRGFTSGFESMAESKGVKIIQLEDLF
ncbi:ATP-binding protein [Oligoflexia bacterium]|nr:ATP-binding protein [Oligoflexia bacterium]